MIPSFQLDTKYTISSGSPRHASQMVAAAAKSDRVTDGITGRGKPFESTLVVNCHGTELSRAYRGRGKLRICASDFNGGMPEEPCYTDSAGDSNGHVTVTRKSVKHFEGASSCPDTVLKPRLKAAWSFLVRDTFVFASRLAASGVTRPKNGWHSAESVCRAPCKGLEGMPFTSA